MAKLNNAPVCFTLAQMRFNSVLDVSAILPALQGALQKAGFPDFEQTTVQGLEFQHGAGSFSFNQKAVNHHIFRNKSRTAAILLDPGALTYELTAYPVFQELSRTFLNALKIVNEHRPIEYCDQLGMRMLDAIQPMDADTLSQYVVPQAIGFEGPADQELDRQHSMTESRFTKGFHTLVVRTFRVSGGIAVPPDLMPIHLDIAPRFLNYKGETIMLDSDSFQNERSEFNLDAAAESLKRLKSGLTAAFEYAITPYAQKAWK